MGAYTIMGTMMGISKPATKYKQRPRSRVSKRMLRKRALDAELSPSHNMKTEIVDINSSTNSVQLRSEIEDKVHRVNSLTHT